MRAFLYYMPDHLLHCKFNAAAVDIFLSRSDQCSLPSKGAPLSEFLHYGGFDEAAVDMIFSGNDRNSISLEDELEETGVDEPVIMQIDHEEASAHIPPDEAADIVHEQWAQRVEMNAHVGGGAMQLQAESLILFRLTRTPRELWNALEAREEIEQLLVAMGLAGQESRHPSGAKLYVHPPGRWLAESIIARGGVKLRFHHILASQDFAEVIDKVVAEIPSRKNVRIRDRTPLYEPPALEVHRTCINVIAPSRDEIATLSSTDAHGGLNPRLRAMRSHSDV